MILLLALCRLNPIFLLDLVKLIEYLASAVIEVSSNSSVAFSRRTKMSFFLIITMR